MNGPNRKGRNLNPGSRTVVLVLECLAILALGIASNSVYRLAVVGIDAKEETIALLDSNSDDSDVISRFLEGYDRCKVEHVGTEMRIGGWPLRYYLSQEFPNAPLRIVWNLRNLLLNISLVWLAMTIVVVYERFLVRGSRNGEDPAQSKRSFQILDGIVLTALIAGVVAYWQMLGNETENHNQIADAVAEAGGNASLTTVLPQFLACSMPEVVTNRFQRLTAVKLDSIKSELLERVLATGTLWSLCIHRGDYAPELLRGLEGNPWLSRLRISGREIPASVIDEIGKCKQLQMLSLIRTNTTAELLGHLGEMPYLVQLDVAHTEVDGGQLCVQPCAAALRVLILPHFGSIREAKQSVSNLQNLEVLHFAEYERKDGKFVCQLEVSDLPALSRMQLDRYQCFDLKFVRLPKLENILQAAESSKTVCRLWARNMEIGKTLLAHALTVQVRSLETLKLTDSTNLSVALVDVEQNQEIESGGRKARMPRVPQKVIDTLGEGVGPKLVRIYGVSCETADLSPLKNNSHINTLDLLESEVNAEQVLTLRGAAGLEVLYLPDGDFKGRDIERIVAAFPKLRRLSTIPEAVDRLRLENHNEVERLFYSPYTGIESPRVARGYFGSDETRGLTALRLVNVAKLKEAFELNSKASYIHLENAPHLVGLAIHRPLPVNTQFCTFENLDFFAGGGKNLDDSKASLVLSCKTLKKLSMAYSGASSQTLCGAGQLDMLWYLLLTGPQVTDDVAEAISRLRNLTHLVLRDTAMTSKSLDLFQNLKPLRRLELDGRIVDGTFVSRLSQSTNLQSLALVGGKPTMEMLAGLDGCQSLQFLDLSECDLGDNALAGLTERVGCCKFCGSRDVASNRLN